MLISRWTRWSRAEQNTRISGQLQPFLDRRQPRQSTVGSIRLPLKIFATSPIMEKEAKSLVVNYLVIILLLGLLWLLYEGVKVPNHFTASNNQSFPMFYRLWFPMSFFSWLDCNCLNLSHRLFVSLFARVRVCVCVCRGGGRVRGGGLCGAQAF